MVGGMLLARDRLRAKGIPDTASDLELSIAKRIMRGEELNTILADLTNPPEPRRESPNPVG